MAVFSALKNKAKAKKAAAKKSAPAKKAVAKKAVAKKAAPAKKAVAKKAPAKKVAAKKAAPVKKAAAKKGPDKSGTAKKADASVTRHAALLAELKGQPVAKTKKEALEDAKEFLKLAGVDDVSDIRSSKDFMLMTLGLNIAAGQSGDRREAREPASSGGPSRSPLMARLFPSRSR